MPPDVRPDDFDLPDEAESGSSESASPETLEDVLKRLAAADERNKLLEAQAAEREKAIQRSTDLVNQLALQAMERPAAAAPHATAPAEPDKDEDPEAWEAWRIEQLIKQRVEAALASQLKPLQERYEQDRRVIAPLVASGEVSAKQIVRGKFSDFSSFEKDIDAYMQGFPAEYRTNPGAIEEAYYRMKGRAAAIADSEAASRATGTLEGRGRPSPTGDSAPATDINPLPDTAKRVAAASGIRTRKEWETYKTRTMDIDEYNALKAEEAARAQRGAR